MQYPLETIVVRKQKHHLGNIPLSSEIIMVLRDVSALETVTCSSNSVNGLVCQHWSSCFRLP
jgi:hypothetical protein